VVIPKIEARILVEPEIPEIEEEHGSELAGLSDDEVFRGAGFPLTPTHSECPHCGMWFSLSGFDEHTGSCPVGNSEELDQEAVVRATSKCEHCGYWDPIHRLDCPTVEKYPSRPDWGRLGMWPVIVN
jgi:ribosomal protein S27AE